MSALLAALLAVVCACSPEPPAPTFAAPQRVEPPRGVWSCPRWPVDDPLSLPAQPEDVLAWKQAQDARKQYAFDECKTDLVRWRDWARSQGYKP